MHQPRSLSAAISTLVLSALVLPALVPLAGPAGATAARLTAQDVVIGVDNLYAIACPSASRCIAVGAGNGADGGDGRTVVITAATGAPTLWPGSTEYPLESISCAGSTNCVAISEFSTQAVATTNGAAMVTHQFRFSGGLFVLSSVSCTATAGCYAGGWEGSSRTGKAVIVHLSATGQLLSQVPLDGTGVASIACPTSSDCLFTLVTSAGQSVEQLDHGQPGPKAELPADLHLGKLSCYGDETCYALASDVKDNRQALLAVDPATGKVGAPVPIPGLTAIGLNCVSTGRCLITGTVNGSAAVSAVTDGHVGTPVAYPGNSLSAAACASSDLCYAVGNNSAGRAVIDRLAG